MGGYLDDVVGFQLYVLCGVPFMYGVVDFARDIRCLKNFFAVDRYNVFSFSISILYRV
jgi:hypothetical protein